MWELQYLSVDIVSLTLLYLGVRYAMGMLDLYWISKNITKPISRLHGDLFCQWESTGTCCSISTSGCMWPTTLRYSLWSRWDSYLHIFDPRIHWFSLINSLVIVVFLCVMVSMILLKTVSKDVSHNISIRGQRPLNVAVMHRSAATMPLISV